MDKEQIFKLIIIVLLSYYLIKGLLYLLLWQVTNKMEEKGIEKEKNRIEQRKEILKKREEKREKNKINPNDSKYL